MVVKVSESADLETSKIQAISSMCTLRETSQYPAVMGVWKISY
jgi:hypothetical protein